MSDLLAASVATLVNGDTGATGLDGTSTATASAVQAKFGTNSIGFSSSSHLLTVSLLGLSLGTEPFETKTPRTVIEGWVYPTSVSGRIQLFDVLTWNIASSAASAFCWHLLIVSGQLALTTAGSGLGAFPLSASIPFGSIAANAWTHVAWEVAPNGTHSVFINGTLAISFVSPVPLFTTNSDSSAVNMRAVVSGPVSSTWGAGSPTYPSPALFAGFVDDFRVTKTARYGGKNFSAPTAAYDLSVPPFAPGDGAAAGVGNAAAPSIGSRLSSGVIIGSSSSLVRITGGRQGTAASAGAATHVLNLDVDIAPPTMSSPTTVVASMASGTVTAVPVSAPVTVTSSISAQLLHDALMSAAVLAVTSASTTAELAAAMSELLRIVAGWPNELGETWAVNVANEGSSRYENFAFNSFVLHEGRQYGCTDDGLYLLDGDDDAGAPIVSSVSFGKQNMSSPMLKRLIAAYTIASSTAPLRLKITTASGDEFMYEARSFAENLATQRFDVGRRLEGAMFTFELFNNDGCDFTLADFEALAADVSHRRI